MSTYQYYEFQAIDRALTREEQEAVARLSSRVEPHPRRAVFTYHWSDFPGKPEDILARYYDAMLYVASWGSTQLMFRFPASVIDLEEMETYCRPLYVSEYVSLTVVGEHVVLDIEFHEDDGYVERWPEEGSLDVLIPLRDDILRGDYRALYLAWLKTLEVEDVLGSVVEPPVPLGLRALSPALRRLVELFEIDKGLAEVAAEASGEQETVPNAWMQRAIAQLSSKERESYLLRLAQGEPHLGLALKRRLREVSDKSWKEQIALLPRRTVGYLLAEAERRRELEHSRQAKEAERRRIQGLDALAEREAEVWAEVDALIEQRQGKPYDEAVQLLLKLRDLARHQGQEDSFTRRLRRIREQYSRRSGLMRRLNQARLD